MQSFVRNASSYAYIIPPIEEFKASPGRVELGHSREMLTRSALAGTPNDRSAARIERLNVWHVNLDAIIAKPPRIQDGRVKCGFPSITLCADSARSSQPLAGADRCNGFANKVCRRSVLSQRQSVILRKPTSLPVRLNTVRLGYNRVS